MFLIILRVLIFVATVLILLFHLNKIVVKTNITEERRAILEKELIKIDEILLEDKNMSNFNRKNVLDARKRILKVLSTGKEL